MKRAPVFLLLIAMLCQATASWASVPLERQVRSLAQVLEHGLMVEHHHNDADTHHDSLEADRASHLHPSEGCQTIALAPDSADTPVPLWRQPRASAPDGLFRSAALPRALKPPRSLLSV